MPPAPSSSPPSESLSAGEVVKERERGLTSSISAARTMLLSKALISCFAVSIFQLDQSRNVCIVRPPARMRTPSSRRAETALPRANSSFGSSEPAIDTWTAGIGNLSFGVDCGNLSTPWRVRQSRKRDRRGEHQKVRDERAVVEAGRLPSGAVPTASFVDARCPRGKAGCLEQADDVAGQLRASIRAPVDVIVLLGEAEVAVLGRSASSSS